MSDQTQDYSGWIGHEVVDTGDDKIGKVSTIYMDDSTGQPEWLAISTGLFGKRSSFVPMAGVAADGDRLVVRHTKDQVKDAPQVEDDADGYLTPEEEDALYAYYGMAQASPAVTPAPTDAREGEAGVVGRDTSGPTTDDAMIRSEERLRVGTRTEETGRARLRKYVVTEQVSQTVPVSHEEVRIEREPITDADRGAAAGGSEISEEEHEVVLHAERPVVDKEVVPVERVRMTTDTVASEETVDDEVREEQIEQVGDEPTDR